MNRLAKRRRAFSSPPVTTNLQVDAYIAKSAAFAQPILKHLRALVHRGCPEVVETIKWSMPSFDYAGRILCHMAAFKAHCAFGFWHRDMEKVVAADGARGGAAMGNFGRITSVDDLPADRTMLRYIKEAAKLNAAGAPARPAGTTRRARPEAKVPPALVAALKKNKAAAAAFGKFSPSQRREYVEWITEAKREETRAQRLATAVAWIAEGKPRHWKYLGC